MVSAYRQKVIVQAGGTISLSVPQWPAGATAEVIVMLDTPVMPRIPLAQLIGCAPGGFASPDEADAFLTQERNRWEF
jgi:hypothetical protein